MAKAKKIENVEINQQNDIEKYFWNGQYWEKKDIEQFNFDQHQWNGQYWEKINAKKGSL